MLEADQVGPRERSPRVAEAEYHAEVDVLGAADAFAEREGGLVDDLADDPPEHQPGRVPDPRHVLAERVEETLGARGRDGRGALAARQLDQARVPERRQRVEADRAAARVERGPASRARTAAGCAPPAPRWPRLELGVLAPARGAASRVQSIASEGSTPPLGACGERTS